MHSLLLTSPADDRREEGTVKHEHPMRVVRGVVWKTFQKQQLQLCQRKQVTVGGETWDEKRRWRLEGRLWGSAAISCRHEDTVPWWTDDDAWDGWWMMAKMAGDLKWKLQNSRSSLLSSVALSLSSAASRLHQSFNYFHVDYLLTLKSRGLSGLSPYVYKRSNFYLVLFLLQSKIIPWLIAFMICCSNSETLSLYPSANQ